MTALAFACGACIAGYTIVDAHGLDYADPIPYLWIVLARHRARPAGDRASSVTALRGELRQPDRAAVLRRLPAGPRRAPAGRAGPGRGGARDERRDGGGAGRADPARAGHAPARPVRWWWSRGPRWSLSWASRRSRCPGALRSAACAPEAQGGSVLAGPYGRGVPPADVRLQVAPYDYAAAERLQEALGVSHVTAQVLVRRGFADPAVARAFLDAGSITRSTRSAGCARARRGSCPMSSAARASRCTATTSTGSSATAVLVRALRTLGADVELVPAQPNRRRIRPGAGHGRAACRSPAGAALLVTVDCAIPRPSTGSPPTARAAGLDVVVTDHHSPRADGRLPDAPTVRIRP